MYTSLSTRLPKPRPKKAGASKAPAKPVAASQPTPVSTWDSSQGRPILPQDFAPAQEFLLSKGYRLGNTGADGKWGARSDAAWGEYTEKDLALSAPGRSVAERTSTTSTAAPGALYGFNPSRTGAAGGLAVPRIGSSTGNAVYDAMLRPTPTSTLANNLDLAQQRQQPAAVTPAFTTGGPPAQVARINAPEFKPAVVGNPQDAKTSLLKRVGEKAGSNPMAAVSAGLGIAGAVMYATAKPPEMPQQQDFNYSFRPARGMDPAAKAAAQNQVISATRSASRPTSANESLNANVRLEGATRAGTALSNLEVQDQQMLRQDQARVEQAGYEQAKINYGGQQQRKAQLYEALNRRYETTRATGGAMVQGALTYAGQQAASTRQAGQVAKQQDNERLRSEFSNLDMLINSGTLGAEQMKTALLRKQELLAMQKEQPVQRAQGGFVPSRFRSGGSVRISIKNEAAPTSGSKEPRSERMSRDFASDQNKLSRQTAAAFSALARELLRVRTKTIFTK